MSRLGETSYCCSLPPDEDCVGTAAVVEQLRQLFHLGRPMHQTLALKYSGAIFRRCSAAFSTACRIC